jgi:hypothetical protein
MAARAETRQSSASLRSRSFRHSGLADHYLVKNPYRIRTPT